MPAKFIVTNLNAYAKEWNGGTHKKKNINEEQQQQTRSIVVPNPNPDDYENRTVIAHWDENTKGYVVSIEKQEDKEVVEEQGFTPLDLSNFFEDGVSSDESDDDSTNRYYEFGTPKPAKQQRDQEKIEQLKFRKDNRASTGNHCNNGYYNPSFDKDYVLPQFSKDTHCQHHNHYHRHYPQHQYQQTQTKHPVTNCQRSSSATCSAASLSPPYSLGFDNALLLQQQQQQQQQHAPLRQLSQYGSFSAMLLKDRLAKEYRASTDTFSSTLVEPPPPTVFNNSLSLLSPYDLLDIQILKEIDPDSIVEVEGERGSITRRRSITSNKSIDSQFSFADDDTNDTTSTTTVKNDGSLKVLEWDMDPSHIHNVTRDSKFDSEFLENKMYDFLYGTPKQCQ